jgi:antirestriction protein ArdC
MSKQSNELIAARLIEKMNDRQSPFDLPGFAMPVNPTTGKSYRGMNALWLAMQGPRDPRWMTLRQASNKNGWKVEKGSKGTLINFLKTTDRVQLLDEQGKPQLNSRNNPKTDLIKLETPVETQAHVFNASQIEGIPALKDYEAERDTARGNPAEQLAKLVELSKAKVEETTGEPGYDPTDRIIYMPEPDSFGTPQEHLAALLYELVKFAGQDKELFDPMDISAAEQARPALASLMLGSEIGVYAQLAPQMNLEDVYETALSAPDQLEAAANDAQYITDYMHGLINSREQRQAARQERFLQVGDVIDYNQKQYEVMGKLRGRDLQMMDKSTGSRFKVTAGDGIYTSLLAAKNEGLKTQREQAQVAAQEQVMGPEEELDNSMQYEHENEMEREIDEQTNRHYEQDEDFPGLELNQDPTEGRNSGMKR